MSELPWHLIGQFAFGNTAATYRCTYGDAIERDDFPFAILFQIIKEPLMQRHVELLRTLSKLSPELAEQLISAWGSVNLHLLVHDITSGKDRRLISYLSAGLLRQFADLDEDHRRQFPSLAPPATASAPQALALDQDYLMVNERFPHVGQELRVTWGTPEFQPYMAGLMIDGRSVNRKGFPEEIVAALANIHRKHDQLFPALSHKSQAPVNDLAKDWIPFPSDENS
jgi:hypothetical protein